MAFGCIERAIKSFFFSYGGFIARHPFPFLLLPLALAVALGAGMVFLTEEQNVEDLYTPENGRAKTDRSIVEGLFTEHGDNDTLVTHLTRLGRSGSAIIRRKDGGNILTESAMSAVLDLHDQVMDITVQHDDAEYTFADLCIMWKGVCNENAILAVYGYDTAQIPTVSLTYPLHTSADGTRTFFLGSGLGSVQFKPNSPNDVLSAEAIQLVYFLRFESSDDNHRSGLWEDKFLDLLESFASPEITVYREVSTTIPTELDNASSGIIKDFVVTFSILINFSVISCMMLDWVRSKPWLASCGVLSAGFAVLSAFGLMCYIGVPYINVVGSTPFLVIGIGLDDMFIMLSAWRQTDVKWTVEKRMQHAFSEAAMSITITSVTDALALAIGTISDFKSVRIFCIYTSVAVIFDYVYQITFFGACMALTGRREAANRHCMSCQKVKPRSESTSTAYSLFCAGGDAASRQAGGDEVGASNAHALMLFFRKYYGPFVTSSWMVALTVLLFLGYLATAIYGCTQVREGLALRSLARDDSYAAAFLEEEQRLFTKYDISVALVFTEPRDVWNPLIQERMLATLDKMEASEYTYGRDHNLTISWLRDYLVFLDSINVTKPTRYQFTNILRENFLKVPVFQRYSLDIVFSEDGSDIEASRFFVATRDLDSTERQRYMMTDLRRIADEGELPAIAYHPAFVYYDQFLVVLQNTLQNIGIAIGAMFIVALLMIPHPICAFLVTLSIASIVTGVVGFMTLWEVNLDSIAMTNIILCIGFSVDFSAHICYAYISANKGSRRKNAIQALYALGMPIVQGSLSTVLGITILAFANSYIFRTFFKTMFLVISLGALHGLVFLPAFLRLVIPVKPREERDENENPRDGRAVGLAQGKDTAPMMSVPYNSQLSSSSYRTEKIHPRDANAPFNISGNFIIHDKPSTSSRSFQNNAKFQNGNYMY